MTKFIARIASLLILANIAPLGAWAATPTPTPTYTKAYTDQEVQDWINTLDDSSFSTLPPRDPYGKLNLRLHTIFGIASPGPGVLAFNTVLHLDDEFFDCDDPFGFEGFRNAFLTCRTIKVGTSKITLYRQTDNGNTQLWQEITVNITGSITTPTPTPSASSSPTPTKSPTPKPSTSFSDLPNNHSLAPAITKLRDQGVIGGYPDGTFKPEAPINRGEYTKIIIGALTDDVGDGKNCFSDVHEEWFAKYVCYAKEHGIIGGYPDGSFHPERNINYAEAVKIAMLAFDRMEGDEAEGTHWYDKYLTAAKAHGYLDLIAVLSTGDPITPTTRAQTAQLIVNVMGE